MPIYSVQGPDGRIYDVEGPEGVSEAELFNYVRRQYLMRPAPAQEPKSGGIAALKAGVSGLKSDVAALLGRTGAISEADAEKYIEEQKAYQARTFKPTETFGEAPLTKFAELLGGSVPYMAAPLAAGVAAAALPVTGTAATVAGLGAAGAASYAQFTGSFLSRQMETGKKLGETELGTAALAAVPAAALDTLSLRLIPGIRGLLGSVGKEVTEAEARALAQQGLGRTFGDYVATTGRVAGTEGLTESAQQFLERLQAGLSISDDDARKEYVDSFLGGAVLGGTLSVPGRFVERGKIKGQAEAAEEKERADARAAAAQAAEAERLAAEARKQDPAYLDELEERYRTLKQTEAELKAATKAPVDKSDPFSVEENRRAKAALSEFKKSEEYKTTLQEVQDAYDLLRPRILERERTERIAAAPEGAQLDVSGEPAGVQDMSVPGQIKTLNQYIKSFDKQIKDAQKADDTQQVALLQQKQAQAREQIAALLPDPAMLGEARALAERQLVDLQTQINNLVAARTQAVNAPKQNVLQINALEDQIANLERLRADASKQAALVSPAARPAAQLRIEEQIDQQLAELRQQLTALKNPVIPALEELTPLAERAAQLRNAVAEIDKTQELVGKYKAVGTTKPVDREAERKKLTTKLQQQAELGEDVSQTLARLKELEAVQEQPALFGEEDLREVKPRDLGDVIADERKKIKDLQNMALMFAEQARQAQAQRGVVRSTNQELLEEARQVNLQLRQRSKDLADLEKLQLMESRLSGQLLGLQGQNKPIPEQLTKRLKAVRKDIESVTAKLQAREPVREGQRELLPAAEFEELAPRVTDEELMAQRDRDIEALLDQYLPSALGVTETQETLALQGPEGERQLRLTTLGKENYAALRQELENVNQRRDDAVVELFNSKGATADALRSEIVMLATREVEITRAMNKLAPLSDEYRQDLQALTRQAFLRPSAVPKGPPNLAEQRYLAAQADLREVENETLDDIYEMRKLEYRLRSKGLPEVTRRSWSFLEGEGPETARPGSTAELIQENPVIQAGMAAQRRLSAAQRRVDELAKAMPALPDLTQKSLDDKLDGLISEFAEGSPKELAKLSKDRRVAMGQRPPAIAGADIGARIAANDAQIKQIRQDLKYAGRPTDPEKVAARDKLVAELKPLLQENEQLRKQYNKMQAGQAAPAAVEETGEVAEMRQELAGIERALASGMFKGDAVQRLEAARDELRQRIEAATGPTQPAAKAEEALLPGMAQRFAQFEYRPVAPGALVKARTEYVSATQKVEDVRKALSRLDEMGPQYFQEVATTYKQNIEREAVERTRLEGIIKRIEKSLETGAKAVENIPADQRDTTPFFIERSNLGIVSKELTLAQLRQDLRTAEEALATSARKSDELKQADAEVTKFLNLAKLAGVGKGRNLREQLDTALDKALADKDKKEAAIKDLETRQRMYEQQEAAKRGVELGDIEAERIVSGEAQGFVSGRGKALPEKPKSKRSWVISTDSKAAVPKPNEAGKLQAATQNAFDLLAQAKKETAAATEALKGAPTPENLAPIKTALERVQSEINRHYTPEQAAEISKEITLLQEKLASFVTPPKIADVAGAFNRAITAGAKQPETSPKSAPMRVAQLMADYTNKETKAANDLKRAEQAITAAEQKYNTAVANLRKAEKKLEKLKDPAKIRGTKLYIDNLYGSAPALRDAVADAIQARVKAENVYMGARLERLLLVQQMGERAKTEAANLTARLTGAADVVTTLTKERDAALEREAAIRGKLTAAEAAAETAEEAAKAAQNAERVAKRLAEEKAKQEAIAAATAARLQAEALRSGLGLPGVRVERTTAGTVGTALQADIKKRLAAAETKLAKVIKSGDTAAITAATEEVKALTTELDQVYAKAPTEVTEVGGEPAKKETPEVVEGMRLAPRKEGPAVRYVRGGNKAIMQAGVTKLRAEGLSQEAANAISLYVKKSKIAGAKKEEVKAKLQAEFDAATSGMTKAQIDTALAEGKRLMGLGPTAELIAKRLAYQTALQDAQKADRAVMDAKTPVQRELAKDAREEAFRRRDIADENYQNAKVLYETSQLRNAKQAERAAVNNLLQEAEETEALRQTGADEDLVPMEYTTATRTESNPAVKDAVQDGRLLEALDRLAVEGANDLIRQVAKELRPLVMRTKVRMDPNLTAEGKAVPAAYSPSENTIYFRPTEITDEDVIHEVTHAATMRVLRMPESELTPRQLAAKREIEAIFAKLEKETSLAGQYGLENVEEFVSEVQSNVEFRAAIDQQPWYKRLWNAIVRLFSTAPQQAVSERASQLIREIYLPSAKVTAPAAQRAASVFRAPKPKYESENALTDLADSVIAQPKSFKERMGSNLALEAEMNAVDMRAAVQEVLKRGAKEMGDDKLFTQAMYNVRKADQYMPLVYTALTNGPLEFYTDDKGLRGIKSSNQNNAQEVFNAVKNVPGKNTEAKFALASTYMIAQRAANKGLSKLDLGELGLSEAKLAAAMAAADADPALKSALEEVRRRYNAYNEGQIKFLADAGVISKDEAKAWLKDGDYVPYYRVRKDGTAELVFGGEKTLTIGDIRTQPYLAELKGGESKILPLNESLIRNTMLITKAALYNNATKEIAYAMQEFGKGRGEVDPRTGRPKDAMPIHRGQGPAGNDIIRFKQEPDPRDPKDDGKRWLRINTKNTAMEGIPSELVVKSLEGAHLTLPAFLKIGGIAGDWLRKGVTRMPPYIFRQLIRDPMAASFTGGLNYGPFRAVVMAGTEFLRSSAGRSEAAKKLIEKGLIQSGVFTGDPDDMSTFATQLASGKDGPAIDRFLGMLDRAGMRADAATRALVYENALKNGLSEVEADMMTMESMNFYKRGLSPTVQYANRLIPFMNAQIQGLNVLVKAMRGNMPFEERQRIQRKFWNNGLMLFGVGLVYAMAMEDDETFKNAKPRDKYTNFFVHLPGVSEAVKVPLPYESGWFFTLAVALADAMKAEVRGEQQLKALRDIFLSSVPGYSSMFMPQAIKPLLEVYTNKNFFSGQNIESLSMQNRSPEERFNASTTEAAKALGKVLPLSPIQIEHIARGYFGTAPLAMMSVASTFMRDEGVKGEAPERRLSETSILGTVFQKKYGGADADAMYSFAREATQRAASLKELQKTDPAAAREYLASHRTEIALAPMARQFETVMGRLRTQENLIRNRKDLSAEEKRARLDQLDKARQDVADRFNAAVRRAEAARAS